jgi:hypothetical protein
MTIKKRTITSFISSVNRVSNEYAYNFTIDYPDGILSCEQQEYIELNVLSFDMLNTMYNMNATNNTFRIKKETAVGVVVADVLCAVAVGNYSVKLRWENRPVNRPASRETGLEMPCCPASDLLWVQITQSYPNRLRFSSLPCPQSPCHAVIYPVFQEGFFRR